MQNAIQSLSNVLLMLRDTENNYKSILDILDRAVKDQGYEYEEKPKKRDFSWDDVGDALSTLAEHRNDFPDEWIEAIDSLLLASQDELGYGRAKYPTPDKKKEEYEEEEEKRVISKKPEEYEEKPKEVMHDKCGKEHKPGECPMDVSKKRSFYSISDIRNRIRDQGRKLVLDGNEELARIFSSSLSNLKTLKDSSLFVKESSDMSGLEELGNFYTITMFPNEVQECLRVKEPSSANDVNIRSAGRVDAVENFAMGVTNIFNDETMSRSAKFGGIQALLNAFAEAVPDLVEKSTPATERDLVETLENMVKQLLPGAIETAMRNINPVPPTTDSTPHRISLTPTRWTPPISGTIGASPRQIAELTTKFRNE